MLFFIYFILCLPLLRYISCQFFSVEVISESITFSTILFYFSFAFPLILTKCNIPSFLLPNHYFNTTVVVM